MKTAEVVQALEAIADDPEHALNIRQVQALLTGSAVIRSLPKPLLASMDILLDLEDTRPKP
ncbi:unnamed protein product [marine sediment metagenome]|uniref:Uncharacterized protein n=1 Tax=marine sediment metagenome TaxID=412755 RepID=X1QYF2_9ZZZZ